MDSLISDGAVSWATIISAVTAVLTLVAAIFIAYSTNRLNRRMHDETISRQEAERRQENIALLRHQKSEIRQKLGLFNQEYQAWIQSETPDMGPLRREEVSLVKEIESAGGDARLLSVYLKLLDGHAFWTEKSPERKEWIKRTFGEIQEDSEWVSGVTNSLLDVVKDGVLQSSSSEDDYDFISDDFWIELATAYFDDESAREKLRTYLDEEILVSAQKRWLPANASEKSQERIGALIFYKVLAEYALATMFYQTFSNGLENKPREDRFVYSVIQVGEFIKGEVMKCAEKQIEAIDAKITTIIKSDPNLGGGRS